MELSSFGFSILSIIKSDIILNRSSSDIRIGVVFSAEGVVKNGSAVDRMNGLLVTSWGVLEKLPSVVIGVVKGPGKGVDISTEVVGSSAADRVEFRFNLL